MHQQAAPPLNPPHVVGGTKGGARATVRKSERARRSNWAFAQMRQFIGYKARLAGVPVVVVDPAYTSWRCSACGHTERRNRTGQAVFWCVACGYTTHADCNAARTIFWAAVRPPIVSEAPPPPLPPPLSGGGLKGGGGGVAPETSPRRSDVGI